MIHAVQQGWQCPVCQAVMSPVMVSCINCVGVKPETKASPSWEWEPKDFTISDDSDWYVLRQGGIT